MQALGKYVTLTNAGKKKVSNVPRVFIDAYCLKVIRGSRIDCT